LLQPEFPPWAAHFLVRNEPASIEGEEVSSLLPEALIMVKAVCHQFPHHFIGAFAAL
jgi:hypothetical protein